MSNTNNCGSDELFAELPHGPVPGQRAHPVHQLDACLIQNSPPHGNL